MFDYLGRVVQFIFWRLVATVVFVVVLYLLARIFG